MKTYKIHKTENKNLSLSEDFWKYAEQISIDCWPWHNELYKTPEVTVKVLYSTEKLFVKFHVKENFIRAQYTDYQNPVCQDSCVEFFVTPDKKKYVNFEVNAIGTLLLCVGKDRYNRKRFSNEVAEEIIIKTSLPKGIIIPDNIKCPEEGYVVAYSIPFYFFTANYNLSQPVSGTEWYGNFYKCGDKTKEPSWGCWNPVGTEKPDFHRPEYFGKLIFE